MKRIGVMTFWKDNENYGQVLQAYALQTVLKAFGFTAFIIPYIQNKQNIAQRNSKKEISFLKKVLNVITHPQTYFNYYKYKINEIIYRNNITGEDRKFDYFRKEHIDFYPTTYSSLEELRTNPPICDYYLCGSDIVWSERVDDMAFFLNFGTPNIKRIAFAASYGGAHISKEYADKIRDYLKAFAFIGVREKSGIEICKMAGRDDAQWVPDPTLLLSKKDYLEMSATANIEKRPYLFLYLLGYKLSIDKGTIFKFAKSKGLKVIYVANKGSFDNYKRTYPTIEEWIGYIANAQYVVTNSFHCAVFCSIFNTNYTFNRIKGHNEQWNERYDSLMNMLGQNPMDFCTLRNIPISANTWNTINRHLEDLRSKKNILKTI